MHDILVVTRKEFREQLRRRRDILRYVWFAVIFGGLFPLSNLGQSAEALAVGSLPWLAYAGTITASGATVGTFFLERQRGTLETLLATPLSDLAIFAGKVAFSLLVSLVALAAAVAVELVVVNVALLAAPGSPAGPGLFSFPPLVYFALFVTGPLVLLYTISTGTLISLRAESIRTANLLSMLSVLPLALPLAVVAVVVRPGLNWPFVLALTAMMAAVDAVALRVALGLFSRETVVLSIPS
jgi:ABC-2 type transport system permease protein